MVDVKSLRDEPDRPGTFYPNRSPRRDQGGMPRDRGRKLRDMRLHRFKQSRTQPPDFRFGPREQVAVSLCTATYGLIDWRACSAMNGSQHLNQIANCTKFR